MTTDPIRDTLVPPPEHREKRWHWLISDVGGPFVAQWEQSTVADGWRNFAGWSGSKAMAGCGVRYHAPADPGAAATIERLTVALRQCEAALVEADQSLGWTAALKDFAKWMDHYSGTEQDPNGVHASLQIVRQARAVAKLALGDGT